MSSISKKSPAIPGVSARNIEAQAILEQARWVYSVIDGRLESYNQRAGVLLAANFAVIALGASFVVTNLDGIVEVFATFTFVPLIVSAVLSTMTILTRSMHDIGSQAALSRLSQKKVPTGSDGNAIYEHLLNQIILGASPQEESALGGLELLAQRKGELLTYATWVFIIAFTFPAVASLLALYEGVTNV